MLLTHCYHRYQTVPTDPQATWYFRLSIGEKTKNLSYLAQYDAEVPFTPSESGSEKDQRKKRQTWYNFSFPISLRVNESLTYRIFFHYCFALDYPFLIRVK